MTGSDHGSVVLRSSSPEETFELGRRLAAFLRAGDVVLLVGELGAGKTTFTRGVGVGLGVRGEVTSPTFVLARMHPGSCDNLPLVHVDAYRLDSPAELDDLDVDAFTDMAVTVVEWGEGVAEGLSESRLRVELRRDATSEHDSDRLILVSSEGSRWTDVPLRDLFTTAAS
jgi:tRNA threonylcarbamoyladenosine biosynthesis protein TsaE